MLHNYGVPHALIDARFTSKVFETSETKMLNIFGWQAVCLTFSKLEHV